MIACLWVWLWALVVDLRAARAGEDLEAMAALVDAACAEFGS